MFEQFKTHIDINKSSYIFKKSQIIKEMTKDLKNNEPIIEVFLKHRDLMREQKFDWIHEAEIEKLNFNMIKKFLKNFLTYFNRDTDKQFGMTKLFQKIFPLEVIYLYFRNLNLSFGNKVYDESLRFKT